MSCLKVCLGATPLLLISFLSQPGDPGGYYNLKGVRLPYLGTPGQKKVIVLTHSSKEEVVHQVLEANMVIDLPSPDIIDSMNEAYTRANQREGLEQKFLVGSKGEVSMIVQGTRYEVPPGENLKAGLDLKTKGDTITAYDVHTHGELLSEDKEPYFMSAPSTTDRKNDYFNYRHQASIILSYDRERSDLSTGNIQTIGSDNEKEKNNYKYVPKIVFYYSTTKPVSLEFDVFCNIVKKIRNN
ncbi:MAG TPA: hypothetical protein VHD83_03700 [Puia sp.]|nr:hypothetical protein [Puia sp.]